MPAKVFHFSVSREEKRKKIEYIDISCQSYFKDVLYKMKRIEKEFSSALRLFYVLRHECSTYDAYLETGTDHWNHGVFVHGAKFLIFLWSMSSSICTRV